MNKSKNKNKNKKGKRNQSVKSAPRARPKSVIRRRLYQPPASQKGIHFQSALLPFMISQLCNFEK